MLDSLFNKVADLQTCNVIKKRIQDRLFSVNIAKPLRTPILRLLYPLEVFCKDFFYRSYENVSFGLLEGWIFIYFLTAITFWLMKYLFRIDEDNFRVLQILHCVVFIAQISHYRKFTALHKLISIVLQLTNKIK